MAVWIGAASAAAAAAATAATAAAAATAEPEQNRTIFAQRNLKLTESLHILARKFYVLLVRDRNRRGDTKPFRLKYNSTTPTTIIIHFRLADSTSASFITLHIFLARRSQVYATCALSEL